MSGPATLAFEPLRARPAREDEVTALVDIHASAFPDDRPFEARRRLFLHNRLGGIEHLSVVEDRGAPVAHAFGFPVGAWFGGKEVPGVAIASVGVALHARGRGTAGVLVSSIEESARERGDAFALLYPFRQGFYGRLGYAPVARHRVLEVSPRAIPKSWESAAPGIIRRPTGADRSELVRVYRAAARVGTGYLERTDRAWNADLTDERRHWLVLDQGGSVEGYVSLSLTQREPHAWVVAEVVELVAPEDAIRRRLFAALRALGDQVHAIKVALAHDDPLDWALVDADREREGSVAVEHPLGVVAGGPMIHLLDVQGAMLSRGYAVDGSIDLAVGDEPPFHLDIKDGSARISEPEGARVLRLSPEALASVAFGGLRLEEAARLGWLADATPAVVAVGAELLRLPAFFSVDGF
jgi:predicted acetyltransferase